MTVVVLLTDGFLLIHYEKSGEKLVMPKNWKKKNQALIKPWCARHTFIQYLKGWCFCPCTSISCLSVLNKKIEELELRLAEKKSAVMADVQQCQELVAEAFDR